MSFLCKKLQANLKCGRVSCDLPIQIKRRGSDNACTSSWPIKCQTDMSIIIQGKTYKLAIIKVTRPTLNELPSIDDKVAGILKHVCMVSNYYV